jgi:hypothetical protein
MKADLERSRFAVARPEAAVAHAEDSLVTDARAGLTPAQMVERKLVSLLPSTPLTLTQRQDIARRPLEQ